MIPEYEKDYNDYVYEDEYYEKEFSGENPVNLDEGDGEEEESSGAIEIILICQECMNRWDDVIVDEKDDDQLFCPYCGSGKLEQI